MCPNGVVLPIKWDHNTCTRARRKKEQVTYGIGNTVTSVPAVYWYQAAAVAASLPLAELHGR